MQPNSASERRFGSGKEPFLPEGEEPEAGAVTEEPETEEKMTDESGRLKEIKELKEVEKVHEETAQSVFVKLGIVMDEKRAKALATILRGKTPTAVILKRKGRGGQEFSYVPGWYVKKMLNALFAMQWDFEIIPVQEGQLFYMSARQVLVMGKLTVRDTSGSPRIVKMALGKKDIAYESITDAVTKSKTKSNTPMDLGNDVKAAETDALKRCATGLGIALDLYANE